MGPLCPARRNGVQGTSSIPLKRHFPSQSITNWYLVSTPPWAFTPHADIIRLRRYLCSCFHLQGILPGICFFRPPRCHSGAVLQG